MNSKLRLGLAIFWMIVGLVLVTASVIPTVRIGLALIGAAVFLIAMALTVSTVRRANRD